MKNKLVFLAGKKAYDHILEKGLSPDDVKVCVSASGAAKWLVLYGLDKMVFGSWLNKRTTPVNFFGTSIGAWKFAAACFNDSSKGFDDLADYYINQRYGKKATKEIVSKTGEEILNGFIQDDKIDEVLSHPYYRISFSAVRCRKKYETKSFLNEAVFLSRAAFANLKDREKLGRYFERTFFMDKRDVPYYAQLKGFKLNKVFLDKDNFKPALLASGSIPLVMNGVKNIPGAPEGEYKDGGMIDYHPFFDFTEQNDIVLYNHFYDYLIPGWFDKKMPGRFAKAKNLDNVLLIAPSKSFVESLPYGRIPDRKDFNRFKGQDEKRISVWKDVQKRSLELGQEFLEIVESGRLGSVVQKFE